MYPFESRFFTTASGQAMHDVDDGNGEPIAFVHGNPSWSFVFTFAAIPFNLFRTIELILYRSHCRGGRGGCD